MLNQIVLDKMTDSEKTDYAKLGEDYWQAYDEVEFAKNDMGYCLEQNTTLDALVNIQRRQAQRGFTFEAKMRKKYNK